MIEIFIAIIIGIFLGIITGLLPGLHVNSIAAIMLSAMPFLSDFFSLFGIAAIIAAMAISHVFFDFLPSIFLGAPEENTALSVLPGHALLLKGKGLFAFRLAVFGCLLGLISVVLLSPILVFIIPFIFNLLQPYIGAILVLISVFVILYEKSLKNKLLSFSVFIISGILGIIVFKLNIPEPLLPMLAGLFGVSTLLKSMLDNANIPEQNNADEMPVNLRESLKSFSAGIFSGSLISIFPAVGPAQSAIVARSMLRKIRSESYLIMLGCIASVSAVFALVTLYSIGKARNGSIVALSQLLDLSTASFYLLMLVMLTSGGIAAILSLNLARYFSRLVEAINYKLLSSCTILFIVSLVFFFSGIIGVLVLATSTAIGMTAVSAGTGRHNAMGCLMLPVIIYYL